jgi:hypothetical protein
MRLCPQMGTFQTSVRQGDVAKGRPPQGGQDGLLGGGFASLGQGWGREALVVFQRHRVRGVADGTGRKRRVRRSGRPR